MYVAYLSYGDRGLFESFEYKIRIIIPTHIVIKVTINRLLLVRAESNT